MNEEFNPQVYTLNTEEFNSFVKKLKEDEPEKIENIILRYISYKHEMAEAALYVAVEKGLISYDLKEKIIAQVRLNFSGKAKAAKQAVWEKNNAFYRFISRYTDEQIYEIIDNPSDIVIDVFHAVILAAKERELITADEFENLFSEAITSSRNEAEISQDYIKDLLGDLKFDEPELTEEQIEANKDKYWKCPSCHEVVDIDLDICWKCQTEKPEKPEHPDREELISELKPVRSFNPFKTGMIAIACGMGIFLLSSVHTYSRTIPWNHRYITLAFSSFFIIVGLAIIVLGFTDKSKKNKL